MIADNSERAAPRSDEPPLVSCLMLTRDRPEMAQHSIQCFLNQTYARTELIIIDSGASYLDQFVASLNDTRLVYHPIEGESVSLGELRNLAAARSNGEFLCQWDDDDLSDPNRLEMQMDALKQQNADACFLSRWIMWWPTLQRIAVSGRRLWEGSILCRKDVMPLYPPMNRGEDTAVTRQLALSNQIALLDMPYLYVYVIHGRNTWEIGHFEKFWNGATEQLEGPSYTRLIQILRHRVPIEQYPA